jgi:hypothetical protein
MSTEWFYEPLSIGGFAVKQKNPDGLRSNPISAVYLEEHALLITAAPEMLEALQEALSCLGRKRPEWRDQTEMNVYSNIKAAIAKAEGRQA